MLIIDSDHYAAAGIETMFFPGGEPHVKLPTIRGPVLCFMKLRTWADTGFAALVVDALMRRVPNEERSSNFFFVPYFPGARQDKYITGGRAACTLAVMTGLFDVFDRDYSTLAVFDPHSKLTEQFLNPMVLMPEDLNVPLGSEVAGIIAPDAGARQRAFDFRNKFHPNAQLIEATKQRDPQTGALSNYILPPLPRHGRYIVVDDICDGGGTFNLLAEAFAKDRFGFASELELFVSHGLFSKGLENLDHRYTHITTTDSWCRLPSSRRLTVLPLQPLFTTLGGFQ